MPLDDNYSFEARIDNPQLKNDDCGLSCGLNCTVNEKAILEYVSASPAATQTDIAKAVRARKARADLIVSLKYLIRYFFLDNIPKRTRFFS